MDYQRYFQQLRRQLPRPVADALAGQTRLAVESIDHGDYGAWQNALDQLPPLAISRLDLDRGTIRIGCASDADDTRRTRLRQQLMRLHPWRKGPFELAGLVIDSEWRSDLKWARLADPLPPLNGRRILDVGCGNGYYMLRMLARQPAIVVGIDPSLLFVMQFHALNRYIQTDRAAVLPLGIESMPPRSGCFDTVFSMGVLYHRKDPRAHLVALADQLNDGGHLVLETLVLDVPGCQILQPNGRYAKMRNVWHIPSPATVCHWLEACGFSSIQTVDITPTTPAEQRRTEWMTFESLADFLSPQDPSRTIEGHPAPVRGIFIAQKKT